MKGSVIIIFLIFLQVNCIKAQSGRWNFDYLTAEDGLSDNTIYTVYRDSKDYLWIGTQRLGINKYDGNNITIYQNVDSNPESISNNAIRHIFEDSKRNVWIGTMNGLNLYHRENDSFTVFKHSADSVNDNNYVTSILEDRKGNLWTSYNNGIGLTKWNYQENSYERFRIKASDNDYLANCILSIKEDSKGHIWAVTKDAAIYRFEPETGDFEAYRAPLVDLGKDIDKSLCIDHEDKIWVGTFGNGLFSFDPATGEFNHFATNSGNRGINNNLISDIIQVDKDHLMISTDQGGINYYNMASKTFEYIVQDEKIENGLNTNGILCLHQDKEGILWVGTSRGGVNYYNPKSNKIQLIKNNPKNPNSLAYDIVGYLYEDDEGMIWIATDGGGLNIYDPKTGDFSSFTHDPSNTHSISGNVIRCITEDKDGDVWVGTWGSGLNRYDRQTKKFHRYSPDPTDDSSISSNIIWHFFIDHQGKFWLSSFYHGVEIFDKKKGVVKRFTADPDDPRSLSHNDAWLIYEDALKNIWICTRNGISLYDSLTNSFTVYDEFPDNDIGAFCRDKDGKLWAGSRSKGLFLFEQDGTIVKVYDESNGLPNNNIQAIVEDHRGNLWISTNNGICWFDQKSQEFHTYSKSDGLQGNVFFEQSFLKTKNGRLYFGGYNGISSFYPDSLTGSKNNYIPKVYITDFRLFNKSVPFGTPGSPLEKHISETEGIKLSWRESSFSFEFTATNYTNNEKTEYAYKLEDFDKEWNYVGNKREATYTNLDPGEYTFRVKASNNDGVWNEQGKSIRIVITPPFSQTIGFKVLVGVCISGLVYLFFFIRTRQLRNNNIKLEKNVQERTEQLKSLIDELKEKQDEIETTNEELTSTLEDLFEQKNHVDKVNEKLKDTQEELQQINEQLDNRVQERTQKLLKANRELDRFVYSASHDLSAPLKSILGLINITRLENRNNKLLNHLGHMENSVKKLEKVIRSLTQFSRNMGFEVKKDTKYFDQIVEEVLSEMNSLFDSGKVKIVKNYSKKEKIKTDTLRLKIILQNLISNAIKYRKIDAEESNVIVGFSNSKDKYQIQIKDDGIGIDPQHQENIFAMFYRGTVQSDGSGLGLYIVKETLSKLNGEIQVESEPDSYTLISISIPKQK